MLNLEELSQLVTFADCGTLSKAAEILHISQPTITRTMQHIEETFGVSLFDRTKNRIVINQVGAQAVEYARKLLAQADEAVQTVQAFDRRLHTISVESCAPAPLWDLIPRLSELHPDNTVSSRILADLNQIIHDVASKQCDIGILPYPCPDASELLLEDIAYFTENLSVCVPKNHTLASRTVLTFEQLNGFNCLLRDQLGFWGDLCNQKMPASRFLVQTKEFEFQELVRTSSLLCFTTNCFRGDRSLYKDRAIIPITDPEANVTFHLISRAKISHFL